MRDVVEEDTFYHRGHHEHRMWLSFNADDLEAMAYAFGPLDGAFREHLRQAEHLRELDEGRNA